MYRSTGYVTDRRMSDHIRELLHSTFRRYSRHDSNVVHCCCVFIWLASVDNGWPCNRPCCQSSGSRSRLDRFRHETQSHHGGFTACVLWSCGDWTVVVTGYPVWRLCSV